MRHRIPARWAAWRRPTLPRGLLLTATWSIPERFGGMTSALLRRSRAFVEQTGTPVQIVTFDSRLDLGRTRARLAADGYTIPGVTLRNFWDEVQQLPDDTLRSAGGPRFPTGSVAPGAAVGPVRQVADTATDVVARFRADGTRLLDTRPAPGRSAREVRVYDRDGAVAASVPGMWPLYRSWLDAVIAGKQAFITVDSKVLVPFFATYRRPHVATLHLVHGSHLEDEADGPHGELRHSRRALIDKIDRFDGVVFLTAQQRDDVAARLGPRPHLVVVPNSSQVTPRVHVERDPERGAVLAMLSSRKRVDHAIHAAAAVTGSHGHPVRLDIYGDGPERDRLTDLVRGLGLESTVRLHGYVHGAADELASASFLLLTSTSEGLPLVLVEAMARGCLPIAYDIRYGPRDVIEHGVDGFLVPAGHVRALAATVHRLLTLPPDRVEAMRAAARAKARRYSDRAIVERWAQVMTEIAPPAAAGGSTEPGVLARLRPTVRHRG